MVIRTGRVFGVTGAVAVRVGEVRIDMIALQVKTVSISRLLQTHPKKKLVFLY